MKTVLKFPLYVEIETDNVDRKRVTDAANQILYPNLLSYLSDAKFRSNVQRQFREVAMVDNAHIKLLTELDLFRKE